MAFFSSVGGSGTGATITVSYSSEFYGETITCSHGTKTYSKTAPSTGAVEFTVYEEGTWTISCTIGADTYSTTAEIDLTESVVLDAIPNGETVLPTDDIETWLACAGITDKAYTTISQVLADSETYNALLGDSNACAYMKRSTTWSTDICADQYAMNLLGQYDTACDALLSDATWASAIANSTYFESVLNVKVPVMTSDTTPSGVASASSVFGTGKEAFRAFDGRGNGNDSTWISATGSPQWIQYQFVDAIKIYIVKGERSSVSAYNYPKGMTLQGSNDGITFTDIGSYSTTDDSWTFTVNPISAYKYHRLEITSHNGTSETHEVAIGTLQFYGRTTSSEKIHGGNPTYDSFYYIDGGNNVPVTDPSLLDAGTYTIYSNGLAKDPTNLSNDYGKTIRICPNTKEIVVRPDNALYWWGYKAGRCEELSAANGWSRSGSSFVSPTFDNTKVTITGASSTYCGIATKYSVRSAKAYAIVTTTTSASENRFMGANTSKVLVADTSFPYRTMLTSIETNAKENLTMNASADLYAGVISLGNYPVAVSAFVLE